ncbi:hypothetical protein ACH5RR_002985 [Cinchona calisaya]|uniref:Uncharacterized protein n=1 Tax=Cinchona calisaya TaxID=153742 RepID=A0ABD3ATI8_9GENT
MITVKQFLNAWWLQASDFTLLWILSRLLPSLICYEIWKARCSSYFEGKTSSATTIIVAVKSMLIFISLAFPILEDRGEDICILLDINLHISQEMRIVSLISWKAPPPTYVKLNIDGVSRGNPGLMAERGAVKNAVGTLLHHFHHFILVVKLTFMQADGYSRGVTTMQQVALA